MRNSCLVHKVNLYGMPFSCKTQINDYDEKIFVRGSDKGGESREKGTIVRLVIARCCVTSIELPGDLGHHGQGAGTLWRGALIVAKGNRTQNSISVVKNLQSF